MGWRQWQKIESRVDPATQLSRHAPLKDIPKGSIERDRGKHYFITPRRTFQYFERISVKMDIAQIYINYYALHPQAEAATKAALEAVQRAVAAAVSRETYIDLEDLLGELYVTAQREAFAAGFAFGRVSG